MLDRFQKYWNMLLIAGCGFGARCIANQSSCQHFSNQYFKGPQYATYPVALEESRLGRAKMNSLSKNHKQLAPAFTAHVQ